MNIGIDIDDTINNLAQIVQVYAKQYNEDQHIDYKIKTNCWSWDEACGWDENHIRDFISKYLREIFEKVTIKQDAAEVINKLKDDGNKIIIISSRSEKNIADIYEVSKKWLNKNNVHYDKLIINGTDKVKECLENDIDIFIDDHIDFCTDVGENTKIKVLMFDSPYNQEYSQYLRVHTWKEVYKKIYEI